jgi:glutamate racemase
MSVAEAPVGVFDSGIGGLTVVRELARLLPEEHIAYLGDTARVPYGIRSPETVRRYATEGTRFLNARGVKFLVVACNTMASVALDSVRQETSVPVVGVIEPGARAAVAGTLSRVVGVIGTEATVRSGAYEREITSLDGRVRVFSTPCPLFVPLAEEGWLQGKVPELVAARYLEGLIRQGIDTLVLGCTHYPLLKPVISGAAGKGVRLIDSAAETARRVREELRDAGLARSGGGPARRSYFVTDGPEKFAAVGGRFLGTDIEHIELIELEVHA